MERKTQAIKVRQTMSQESLSYASISKTPECARGGNLSICNQHEKAHEAMPKLQIIEAFAAIRGQLA